MRYQREAAQGRFAQWLSGPLDYVDSRIGDHEDLLTALLMLSPPEPDSLPAFQRTVQDSLETAAVDMIRHGAALLCGDDMSLKWLDIRYCWPVEDGMSWLVVNPEISTMTGSWYPDQAECWLLMDDRMVGVLRKWGAGQTNPTYGSLGDIVGVFPEQPARYAPAYRPPKSHRWGTSLVDKMLPVCVEMIRRESGMSYAIDRNERPMMQIKVSTADLLARGLLQESEETGELGLSTVGKQTVQAIERQVAQFAQSYRQHDVSILLDGMDPAEMLEWSQNMGASDDFLQRLDMRLEQITGFTRLEPGDSGAVESGVAVARRQAFGMARTRSHFYSPLLASASHVVGRPLDWTFVDTTGGEAEMADDAGPIPDPGGDNA